MSSAAFMNSASAAVMNKKQTTPYCDVCYKKGLPKSNYTSHYPKSVPGPKGIVTCPTILAAVCNVCGKSGHWANEKFCPAMKQMRKGERVTPFRSSLQDTTSNCPKKINENRFEVLRSMDDVVTPHVVAKVSWADITKKPVAIVSTPVVESKFTQLQANMVYSYASNDDEQNPQIHEAKRILNERQAAGYFDVDKPKKVYKWSDVTSDDEDEDW